MKGFIFMERKTATQAPRKVAKYEETKNNKIVKDLKADLYRRFWFSILKTLRM
jgi:hypothetical protein